MKLDVTQAEALTRLRDNPDFHAYMGLLGDMAEESMMVLIKSNDNLERAQGRCQALTEIIEAIEAAPSTLEQYQNSK